MGSKENKREQAEELPAWERASAQSPNLEDPDRGPRRILGLVVLGLVLFVLLPWLAFSIASCSLHQAGKSGGPAHLSDKQYNQEFQSRLRQKD